MSSVSESQLETLNEPDSCDGNAELVAPLGLDGVQSEAGHVSVEYSPKCIKKWNKEIQAQETAIADARHNALNPDDPVDHLTVWDTDTYANSMSTDINAGPCCNTQRSLRLDEALSPEEVIRSIGNDYHLNEKQWCAYRIITEYFVQRFVLQSNDSDSTFQLTMLMMGPGGTGKTHIVKVVHTVMEYYGYGFVS